MQLNCILFPGRKTSNISEILDSIVLIPKDPDNTHIYYSAYINHNNQQKDYLLAVINKSKKQTYNPQNIIRHNLTPCTQSSTENEENYVSYMKQYHATKSKDLRYLKQNMSYSLTDVLKTNTTSQEEQEQAELIKVQGYIPCLFIPGNQKLIVYLHGNAEDLASTTQFVGYINKMLGFSVLVMEYPGYSIYQGSCNAQKIQIDCLQMISYLLQIGYQLGKIFVIGRSIGTGPALFLCTYFRVAGLMLISPFLSICSLVRDKYGFIPSILVKQRFLNYKIIEYVQIPIFILHGLQDSIVPFYHTHQLQQFARGKCYIKLVQKMTHTSFDFKNDFLEPLKSFLSIIKF